MDDEQDLDNVLIESMDETQILSSLLWVSELIGSTTDIDELLQLIVELTPKMINVNRCSIFLWDSENEEFIPRISYSPELEEREIHLAGFYAMRIKLGEIPTLASKLIREKVPVIVRNAKESTVIPKRYVDFFDIKSAIAVPLLCKGEFIGAMVLDHIKDTHHYTQKEIRVAMGLATHAAVAIRNAQLISSLREERERSSKILETIADGLLVISPENLITMTNYKMARLVGLSTEKIIGHSCRDVFKNGIVNGDTNYCRDHCPMRDMDIDPTNANIEGCIATKDDKIKWISSNYAPALDLDGNLLYTVVTVRDITDKKEMEGEIVKLDGTTHRRKTGTSKEKEFLGKGI